MLRFGRSAIAVQQSTRQKLDEAFATRAFTAAFTVDDHTVSRQQVEQIAVSTCLKTHLHP